MFSQLNITSGYWIFDGQTGGGPSTWNVSQSTFNFGFEISHLATAVDNCPAGVEHDYDLINFDPGISTVTIQHVNVHGVTTDCGPYACYPTVGLHATGGSDHLTLKYNTFNTMFGVYLHLGNWSNVEVSYNYFAHIRGSNADPYGKCDNVHSAGFSFVGTGSTHTYYNNLFYDMDGTAIWDGVNPGTHTYVNIYGNMLIGNTLPLEWDGVPTNSSFVHHLNFFNNTMVRSNTALNQGGLLIPGGVSDYIFVYNNIWWNSPADTFVIYAQVIDYNTGSGLYRSDVCSSWDNTTFGCNHNPDVAGGANGQDLSNIDPFLNSGSNPLTADYHINEGSGIAPGFDVGAPFNVDAFGVTRGANGTWDRGAYQTASTTTITTTPHISMRGRVTTR